VTVKEASLQLKDLLSKSKSKKEISSSGFKKQGDGLSIAK